MNNLIIAHYPTSVKGDKKLSLGRVKRVRL